MVTFSTARRPNSSVAPWLTPPFTPAPIIQQVNPSGLWSRPRTPAWCVGMRPNSVVHSTSVSSSMPDCLRSASSAAVGWSKIGACRS
ncbi:unnamed protein product [Gemmataceae bacterium]|nr:unnamed protein product [Gemmataceae bacterium]VTT96862.1 unnamed protein product [Gemmataceae bacterium]